MLIQIPQHFAKNPNTLQLSSLSLLYYFNKEQTQKVNVQLNKHMLIHVFNGSKTIHIGDNDYAIQEHQSAFISKGQYFISERLSDEKSYFDGIMVFFDDEFLHKLFTKYNILKEKIEGETLNSLFVVEDSTPLHETMLSAKSYLQRESNVTALVELKFEEIFLQLIQSNKSKNILHYLQTLYTSSIYKFQDLIQNGEFTSVKDMMAQSKLSEPQFRKTFTKLYKTTPKEWLLKRSLLKAKTLLEDKSLSVTEVSLECGFNSLSWFTKSFKEAFDTTPKKYQQNY
ncbi:helix-turn-helix transcriptional regulator [Sulfurimonas sp. SAG-AH-194-C20]|nr:helix-turn-helix transcriptional regulator [Sulfurimonas sp. SAG-AH-194-C20]MDF1878310.1 helix-turn-helix transcriptional regulator [Sulfurimonas sp. SAG-AH-194-C20]